MHRCILLHCSFVELAERGGGGGGGRLGGSEAGTEGGELVDKDDVDECVDDELLVLDLVESLVRLN